MAFVIRFGGWRPVQLEEGRGVLRVGDDITIEDVAYRFEVWHQMVGGLPGPFRSEGELGLSAEQIETLHGGDPVLMLEDGRSIEVRVSAQGELLAHGRPVDAESGRGASA